VQFIYKKNKIQAIIRKTHYLFVNNSVFVNNLKFYWEKMEVGFFE